MPVKVFAAVMLLLYLPLCIAQAVETPRKTPSGANLPESDFGVVAAPAAEVVVADTPIVRYTIDVQWLPENRKLLGEQTLVWRNASESTVSSLQFHLYYNAFRSPETTFMRESPGYPFQPGRLAKMKFGEIRIREMVIPGGEDLTSRIKFIAPDDGNSEDRTVIEVPLSTTLEPGQSVTLKIRFESSIPSIFARTGQEDDFLFMGQWFPKIGVLQPDGLWHCHQFHRNSEFFADYGDYRVTITVPAVYVVGATGNLTKREKNADGTVSLTYEESNIHDFAWTAYPGFKRYTEKVTLKGSPGGAPTEIELLLADGHDDARFRHLDAIKFALNFFAEHIMPYPYKKITVVDPPFKGLEAGGMEYPTLITTMFMRLLPEAVKLPELVTIHEFAHQYWYGIIGSDEFREAWLDEGVTSFFELEIMDEFAREEASLLNSYILGIEDREMSRARYSALLPGDRVSQFSWNFLNGSQYAGNVYSKAAIFLTTLKNYFGRDKIYNFFRFYARKYAYKHPTTADFITTFNAFFNEDFTWAFELYINGDAKLDHEVLSVRSVRMSDKPEKYYNEAVFLRKEGYFPVELLVKLENGKEIKSFWNDREKWKRVVFQDVSPIRYAAVDPKNKLLLDTNLLNNSRRIKPEVGYIRRLSLRFGFFFQNLMGFLAF